MERVQNRAVRKIIIRLLGFLALSVLGTSGIAWNSPIQASWTATLEGGD